MSSNKQATERVHKILQEIRIVLPGTQTLLGFQFVAFFNETFKNLSHGLQLYHLINLFFITCCTVLLISPVAYQEILEDGKDTQRFLQFTQRVITIAMFFLLLGLSGDVFVATSLLGEGFVLPLLMAIGTFVFGGIMWFGIAVLKGRNKK